MSGGGNPNHDSKTGEFSSGAGGGGGGSAGRGASAGNHLGTTQRDRLRAMAQHIRTEHAALAQKLSSGTINSGEVARLDKINQFVLKNKTALGRLK